jgi:putative N-acetylmannosamine-6-phosphate epimerase
MTLRDFLATVDQAPLIASVQAPEGSPLDSPHSLCRCALASLENGVSILRLQGVENIRYIHERTKAPTIGLIKRVYDGSAVYITPTIREVGQLLETPAEVIALDGTRRSRPGGERLEDLIRAIHAGGRVAMADCDTLDSMQYSVRSGADLVGTTLAGYTEQSPDRAGPALDLLRQAVAECGRPVLAEGRYAERWQVEAALAIGARGVVVGGALNDPIKNTLALLPRSRKGRVGAADLGGTWLRFAAEEAGQLYDRDQVPTPEDPEVRIEWIRSHARRARVASLGVGTGGTVNPSDGEVWEAKPLIPGHVGCRFEHMGVPVLALNDGLATAWGHAQLPRYAGKRVATLALGTGVGCGMVAEGKLWTDLRGRYPRLNDLRTPSGASFEELLGGAALTPNPGEADRARALEALEAALDAVHALFLPDHVVIAGSVGLSDWIAPRLSSLGLEPSPFGTEAGLHGAAALARFPPFPLHD